MKPMTNWSSGPQFTPSAGVPPISLPMIVAYNVQRGRKSRGYSQLELGTVSVTSPDARGPQRSSAPRRRVGRERRVGSEPSTLTTCWPSRSPWSCP